MKRNLIFGAAFLLISWAATSCESLASCKTCKTISKDSITGQVSEGTDTEYCGTELIDIESKVVTVGNVTTKYQCR
jgi:hypothetical protein